MRWLVGFVVVLLALIIGAYGWMTRPRDFTRDELPRETTAEELALAGWYADETGHAFLLTPSADGGLFRLDLPGYMRPTYPDDIEVLTARPLADAPYTVQQIAYESDVALSGTLLIPTGVVRAGAVMIHGSGPSDRDNGWYMAIADDLARHGVAVLVPDKRGTGQSRGTWQTSSFDDFADDAIAGLEALRRSVDVPRAGFIGISQAGWVAPLAAERTEADFTVGVSSALVPPLDQLAHETRQTLRQMGLPNWLVPVAFPVAYRIPQWDRAEWWTLNGNFDPVAAWQNGTVPGWITFGTEDANDNVPLDASIDAFEGIRAVRGEEVELTVYPGSGHGLIEPGGNQIRRDFLDGLSAFAVGAE